MFSIDNRGNMTITRGDSASILLFINDGTFNNAHQYDLQADDYVIFYIMDILEKDINKSFVIKKFDLSDICNVVDSDGETLGTYIYIPIDSNDTKELYYKEYAYTIKLFTNNGECVDTIGPRRYFYVND
jgi:hypothetical protein